ncbi:HNH endonuclease [Kitasatospora sp. NPDC059795]|uniref:HNH endonuclease n=1 Tax=Kitasatospora sp. NPDC059795 TaxID=3346949 RepID=UPI003658AC47
MHKGALSRDSVLMAIEECDRLGRDAFLEKYHYGPARDYLLVHDGREYDSKAIAGVSHQFEYGRALESDEFNGGRAHAVAWLERIGFRVKAIRNPDWAWDELVLACAITAKNDWKGLTATDSRVVELSGLLQLLPIHPVVSRNETFRNVNGVARKTVDIATHHPSYQGKPTKGGALDLAVLKAFMDSPLEMAAAAELLRVGLRDGEFRETAPVDGDPDEFDAPEGRLLVRRHLSRERNRGLRQRKIDSVVRRGRSLACEVCGFDFKAVYGDRGDGYIECHHIVPLHEAGEGRTKLSDLALICSNCHRMVHRRAPWPTPDELRAIVTGHQA